MVTQVFYQISLLAAFVAGMVALFAPCCISYLLPAYLGNVFKERKQVLGMTLVYSLGIFVVMLPVVLGARALSMLFFQLHDQAYLIGGLFMLVVAGMTFLGIKLPLPHMAYQGKVKNDVLSTFILGLFSGITSACCAPVLVGVMALSSLSPSTFQALGVGMAYVLGMVTPLYLASAFIHQRNILEKPIFRQRLMVLNLGGRQYPIFVANVVGTAIFLVTGSLMVVLTYTGKLAMPTADSPATRLINNTAMKVTELTGNFPIINVIFLLAALYLLYKFLKSVFHK